MSIVENIFLYFEVFVCFKDKESGSVILML